MNPLNEQVAFRELVEVHNLVAGLTAGTPERFFVIYNALKEKFPGISFETANTAAWEQYNFEQETLEVRKVLWTRGCTRGAKIDAL